MKPKVFIKVEGGLIQGIGSNTADLEIIYVDYDDESEDAVVINGPAKADFIFTDGKAAEELFSDGRKYPLSEEEKLVKQHLIEVKF